MALSFRSLETLRTVSDAGSFAAAARQLGLTQPGVSQHVRKIEEDYSVELFLRRNGKLVPTPFCERLCDAADRVMREHAAVEQMLQSHGKLARGQLSVGLGNAMPGMSVIAAFRRAFPDVFLRVTTGSHETVLRGVANFQIDVGILPEVPKNPRFRRKAIDANAVVAIVSETHPLASRARVTCMELMGQSLIFRSEGSSTQRVVDRYFRRQGATPTPVLVSDTRDGVYEAVVNGMGVGFVWQTATQRTGGVRQIALEGDSTKSTEVAFALNDHDLETVNAFFRSIDDFRYNGRG